MKNDEAKPDWLSAIDDEAAADASLAWEEYRSNAEKVGSSNLVCASLRRNFEVIAMKAVKGA